LSAWLEARRFDSCIFAIKPFVNTVVVTINDLTFRNGDTDNDEGGAILARNARLTLNRVAFENNPGDV
jgi:hypothetical protein